MNLPTDHTVEELPAELRAAFETYPRITASADFNRRVLDIVLQKHPPSPLEIFCDRLDEIFARPVLKLLGTTSLGIGLAYIGVMLLAGPEPGVEKNATDAPPPAPQIQVARTDEAQPGLPDHRLALGSRIGWTSSQYFDPTQTFPELPAKREKTPDASGEETSTDERRSSCPDELHSLV